MIFQQLFDPISSTYSYVLAKRVGGEALIIDPVFEHVDSYVTLCNRLKLKLVKAVDTHVHADHITGLGALREITRCVTVMGERSGADVVSMRVREDERIDIDGVSMRVMYTPGHTDDSYSFVMNDRVFTGDTLLIRGTGRTDFQNGDPRAAFDSLFNKLLKLEDDMLVYPAHDYNGNTVSTIADEKRNNPRLQVKTVEEYVHIMNNLKLANPKMMDVAVPANRTVGLNQKKYIEKGLTVEAEDAVRRSRSQDILFVDLREDGERARDGWIPRSVHIPYGSIEAEIQANAALRDRLRADPRSIVFYCAFGERSALALDKMAEHGIDGGRHLLGGLGAWIRAGGDVETARS